MNVTEQKGKQKSEYVSQTTDELTKDMLNVDLSSIKPTTLKIHPDWESLLRLTQLRVTQELGPGFKLNEDFSQYSLHAFASLRFDMVYCIIICNMAFCLLDDYLDKYPLENEKIIEQLRNKNFPGNGKIAVWLGLFIKVCRETMCEMALSQLVDMTICAVSKAVVVNRICIGEVSLSDKNFLELRCIDVSAAHQFFLMLTGIGKQLTAELLQDPNYLGLNKQATIQVTLINDLYSFRKEIHDDQYRCNYVFVKMTNNHISAQAAVDAIIREMRDAEKMARVYGDRMKEMNDPHLSQYVDGMYEIMAGNHYWSSICKRYNDL